MIVEGTDEMKLLNNLNNGPIKKYYSNERRASTGTLNRFCRRIYYLFILSYLFILAEVIFQNLYISN